MPYLWVVAWNHMPAQDVLLWHLLKEAGDEELELKAAEMYEAMIPGDDGL